MFTCARIIFIASFAAVVTAIVAFPSIAYSQDTAADCRFDSIYRNFNPAIELEPSDCDAIVRDLRVATTSYLRALCRLDEARMLAPNPENSDVVNSLVVTAAAEFGLASRIFSRLAERPEFNIEITSGDQFADVQTILGIYRVERDLITYQDSQSILAAVAGQAASELQDVRFGSPQPTDATTNALYSLMGAMLRPGGVYRAMEAAINRPES